MKTRYFSSNFFETELQGDTFKVATGTVHRTFLFTTAGPVVGASSVVGAQ